jgi:hypothetical protein
MRFRTQWFGPIGRITVRLQGSCGASIKVGARSSRLFRLQLGQSTSGVMKNVVMLGRSEEAEFEFLPGPASDQVAVSLGVRSRGVFRRHGAPCVDPAAKSGGSRSGALRIVHVNVEPGDMVMNAFSRPISVSPGTSSGAAWLTLSPCALKAGSSLTAARAIGRTRRSF